MHINFLKKYYFISKFDPDHIINLDKNISIIYRNYSIKYDEKLILKIKKFCKKNGRKFYISNDLKLALKLNLEGVYLPSFNNSLKINLYLKKKNFLIIGSAHNIKEIKIKENQNVKEIFLSPLFKIKNGTYLGLNRFNILSNFTKINKIALGGINKNNINKLSNIHISGFAGIKYFDDLKKKAPKNRGL